MPKLQFTVKPAVLPAVLPYYAVWTWRFFVAAAIVYGGFRALALLGVFSIDQSSLLLAVLASAIVGTVISAKHRLLRIHSTKYRFYDTHVVRETKLLSVERQSMPYTHISKVTNDSSFFQRIIGVSDLVLHAARNSENDLVIASVRDSNELEHRIYSLLEKASKQTEEE